MKCFLILKLKCLDSLTEEGIRKAPKMVTSIAWYDKRADQWGILILDKKRSIKTYKNSKIKKLFPVQHEEDLLYKWIEKMERNPT